MFFDGSVFLSKKGPANQAQDARQPKIAKRGDQSGQPSPRGIPRSHPSSFHRPRRVFWQVQNPQLGILGVNSLVHQFCDGRYHFFRVNIRLKSTRQKPCFNFAHSFNERSSSALKSRCPALVKLLAEMGISAMRSSNATNNLSSDET
ncbi:hypothetical protein CIHG_04037 [Coccidioides immitis H538.4]|uniref:Uncharacterized protein n=3 Tax=Coccidioides immitis TaxID=5501 RepID=A0A0J8R6I3_COCIT|nr:hypothetical protein CIRG_03792 [Coccidioides immitis RMSCC 2394]KMU80055.1 hypothetical protein CISG_08005 [Coccidioides immitis RMSCC 3703]KMU86249.1 hypothetical protein CIHG_04037 [Coccidioides immitis H538.4]